MVPLIRDSLGLFFEPVQLSPESFRALASLEHTFPGGAGAWGGAGAQFKFWLV